MMMGRINTDRSRFFRNALRRSTWKGTALIPDASSAIGVAYADQLAARGYDLILGARDRKHLDGLKNRVSEDTGRVVEILVADLSDPRDLARMERVIGTSLSLSAIIHNTSTRASTQDASVSRPASTTGEANPDISAIVRLCDVAVPLFLRRGGGAIIAVSSSVDIRANGKNGISSLTDEFTLAYVLSLHRQFARRHIRIQSVLLDSAATELRRSCEGPSDESSVERMLQAEAMVEEAMNAFDEGQLVTFPLPTERGAWDAFQGCKSETNFAGSGVAN
jgi:short-subunit dehydrogenase